MKQNRGRAHLTLASENSSRSTISREVIGIDALSPQQLTVARHLFNRANCTGVIVGALVGEESWDTRPLVLVNGKLCLLRFSDPGAALDRNKMNFLKTLYTQLGAHKDLTRSALAVGQSEGQIWILRRFNQNTLSNYSNPNVLNSSIHPVHQAQKLIELVGELQTNGIIHGHLNFANIGTDEEQPMILDFGLGCVEGTQSDLAPEILAGMPPSLASDIYGLGKILEVLLKGEPNPEIQSLVKKMISNEPSDRPRLEDVKKAFLVKKSSPKIIGTTAQTMKSGQVLGKAGAKIPKAPEVAAPPPTQEIKKTEPPPATLKSTQDPIKPQVTLPPKVAEESPASELRPEPKAENLAPPRARHFTTLIQTNKPAAVAVSANLTATPIPKGSPARKRSRIREEHYELEIEPSQMSSNSQALRDVTQVMGRVAWFMIFVAILVAGPIFGLKHLKIQKPGFDYAAYWESGQPKLQREVVTAAVVGNSAEAQKVITDGINLKTTPARVRNDLLKVGFSKLWSQAYSIEDKKILFALSLEDPGVDVLKTLPPINSAHPGVVIALASQLSPNKESPISALSLDVYSRLPKPFAAAFTSLESFGVKKVGETTALGLARITAGNISEASLLLFIDKDPSGKVAVLKIMADELGNEFGNRIIETNRKLGQSGLPELTWFDKSKNVDWNSIQSKTRLAIASGSLQFKELSIEHQLDLLSSPLISTKETIAEGLILQLGDKIEPVIKVLLEPENGLQRDQIVTLISALSYQGENSKKFISDWFKSNPDSQTVFNLLMVRDTKENTDFFNLQAARYLADKKWVADFGTLKELALHREPVARALAYARFDPNKKEELQFLRRMANVEPVNSIRKGILTKLKPFDERSSVINQPVE
jgi:serine/threonine protein kinase